jgi:hypothetical protein
MLSDHLCRTYKNWQSDRDEMSERPPVLVRSLLKR